MSLVEVQQGWDRFDEALYEYARECAEAQFEDADYVEPSGGTLWAYGYMSEFFERLDWDVLRDVDLDEVFVQDEAEDRFVWLFQQFWDSVRYGLS